MRWYQLCFVSGGGTDLATRSPHKITSFAQNELRALFRLHECIGRDQAEAFP